MPITDRDSAVDTLRQLGFVARARDWALGRTVFVTLPHLVVEADGIGGARQAIYLCETPDGWSVETLQTHGKAFEHFEDAVAFMRFWFDFLATRDALGQKGFRARQHPDIGETTLLVSLPEPRTHELQDVRGWRKSMRLRQEPSGWWVGPQKPDPGGQEDLPFPTLDAAVDYLREQLHT
ncbi:hypothetical protein [Corallococcus terminator]|uniref:Uncharacterized protein n=1 Tax=Corallococcus terminator TaxID=2316733 RepID=A0A3A8J748_9BACT|nr:hypothetical protein [Corallococcus terminator]RKG91325.1 hypothetical protein D7V88_09450 [Corallococcus terminator]